MITQTDMNSSPTKPYVEAFAKIMEDKLRQNRHKGDRAGWMSCSPQLLLNLLFKEVRELEEELEKKPLDAANIAKESADVANFAMMIADACGGLTPDQV